LATLGGATEIGSFLFVLRRPRWLRQAVTSLVFLPKKFRQWKDICGQFYKDFWIIIYEARVFVRQGRYCLTGTNTLAYHEKPQIDDNKVL
jgi:hypothetical protein